MESKDTDARVAWLMDRLDISDVIARYARGIDRLDEELFQSTYAEDALDDHAVFVGSRDELYGFVAPMLREHRESTHHMLGQQTVEIAGDTAHAETYYIATTKNRTGTPLSMLGGRYADRLGKIDGSWVIQARIVLIDWELPAENTREFVEKLAQNPLPNYDSVQREMAASRPTSTRDRHDPSYARPLQVSAERVQLGRSGMSAQSVGTS